MAIIGNPIISTDFPKDTFSGNGSTTAFTMSIAPASVNAVIVVVSGITQDPSTYTISGTTLTFSAAPPTGTNNISVRHLGVAGTPQVPADASVTSAKLASGAALANLGSSQLASANLPAGSVLQVVTSSNSTYLSTSSSTFIDSGVSCNITPKFSTSKILAIVTLNGTSKGGANGGAAFALLRDSTTIQTFDSGNTYNGLTTTASSSASTTYLDSPSTVSAITYKVQIKANNSVTAFINNYTVAATTSVSTLTLIEVAG